MTDQPIYADRSAEEKKAHVASKTMYLNKTTYADLMFIKRLVVKLAENQKLDIEAIKKDIS